MWTVDVSLSFRIDNVSPQIWDAFTGNQQDAKIWKRDTNRTNVALSLPSNGQAHFQSLQVQVAQIVSLMKFD